MSAMLAIAFAVTVAPQAQTVTPQSDAQGLRALAACRAIAAPDERLACYDKEAIALEQAVASGDLVALDREEVRKTRRSLFGFNLPAIRLFSRRDDRPAGEQEAVDQLAGVIKSARQLPRGKWQIELEDGAVWTQVDTKKLTIDPRSGHKIEIRRAALGSYLANVNGQTAIRVQRTQ
ncbi:hypothetical protein [Sphingomonas baiyangensis]|uniref:Uncharacterized protein n=1 Tax=Sphingomonas baiyangensis TaxID=2572576 RepID=A0A4U1L3P0_9SPHN|nr:hypothetical protein [Sphingomonas baiyangensis]TKD51332.1 hypothetical protein FBR43_11645 [Sphingomonas baiyangensis]